MQILGLLALVLAVQVLPGSGARKKGRDGNTHYKESRYEEATQTYTEGVAAYDQDPGADDAYYGLQNNLGAALYRQQNFDGASAAFARAADVAENDAEFVRSTYNAGNTAFQRQDLDAALAHYRNVLMTDPGNEDARYNYEFALRQQQQQQQQQQNEDQEEENSEQDQQQEQENEDGQQDQQQEQEDGEQEQQGEQQDQEQQQESEQQEQPSESQPSGQELTPEQAERILQAMENDEEQLLREIRKVNRAGRRVAKDW